MALTDLGNTDIKVDTTKISAKTPVVQQHGLSVWTFNVLVDGQWIPLQYTTESAANSAYAAIT